MAKNYYHKITSVIKKIDRMTNYKTGCLIRSITNINTRKYWDKKLASYQDSWRDFPYENILEFLPKDNAFSLLDIGCALGDGCILLKKHFPDAHISGADFSEVAIEKARKRTGLVNFFVMDILKDSPPKKYDYIILLSTLEHFNNPHKVVDKCLDFVNRTLIIQAPYTEKIDEPCLYLRGLHRYLFNEETFKRYNFKILKITDLIEATGYRYIVYELRPDY